jgi:hypothetical protein
LSLGTSCSHALGKGMRLMTESCSFDDDFDGNDSSVLWPVDMRCNALRQSLCKQNLYLACHYVRVVR